jgi:unspecific monooxygenase
VDIAQIPHPPRRVPVIGDVAGIKVGKPVQSVLAQARGLGPISVRKVLRTQVVTVGGAELAGDLSDESRFCKVRRTAPAPAAPGRW